jgi:hypothetical protein
MSVNASLAFNKPAYGCWFAFNADHWSLQLRAAWLYVAVSVTKVPEVPQT